MTKSKSKKSNSLNRADHMNILAGLVFALAFAVITTLSAYSNLSWAAKPGTPQYTPNLSLLPRSQTVQNGSNLSIEVWADSGSQEVNAVQANLIYPADKLNFLNINSTNSGFEIAAENTGANGLIKIARGTTAPKVGKQLVAIVSFSTLSTRGKASVNFTTGSALSSYSTHTDVLLATYGGSYSL
jgi:hypothetical protein